MIVVGTMIVHGNTISVITIKGKLESCSRQSRGKLTARLTSCWDSPGVVQGKMCFLSKFRPLFGNTTCDHWEMYTLVTFAAILSSLGLTVCRLPFFLHWHTIYLSVSAEWYKISRSGLHVTADKSLRVTNTKLAFVPSGRWISTKASSGVVGNDLLRGLTYCFEARYRGASPNKSG